MMVYFNKYIVPKAIAKGGKARLGDALIAQTCIDKNISLLTRDRDFRAFGDAAGLDLVLGIRTDWPRRRSVQTLRRVGPPCTTLH
jgi:hypothetical protein